MKYICKRCNKEFNAPPSAERVYCSKECHYNTQEIDCEECGKTVKVKYCNKDRKRFCSRSCQGKNTPIAKGEIERNTEAWNKGKKLHYDVWNKGGEHPAVKGEKNPNWKGGKTELSQYIRTSKQYKKWRSKVYERDNYTCQECGERGVDLNADHIKPFAIILDRNDINKDNFKHCEELFDLENGRTLCRDCHKETETYGINFIKYEKQYATV